MTEALFPMSVINKPDSQMEALDLKPSEYLPNVYFKLILITKTRNEHARSLDGMGSAL